MQFFPRTSILLSRRASRRRHISATLIFVGLLLLGAAPPAAARDRGDYAFVRAESLRIEWRADALRRAIRLYSKARSHWQRASKGDKIARALSAAGNVHFILSEYKEALACYRNSLAASKASGDRMTETQALNDIAAAFIEMERSAESLEYSQKALELSRSVNDQIEEARALNMQGLAHYVSSDMVRALDLFKASLGLVEQPGDHLTKAKALINAGYAYGNLGYLDEAFDCFNKAMTGFERLGDRRGQALAMTARGGIFSWRGEKQKALGEHEHALDLFRAMGDRSGQAAALNGIGFVYEDLGQKHRALRFYEQAMDLYRSVGKRVYAGVTAGYVASMHDALGDKRTALDYLRQKLTLSRATDERRMQAYTLREMGALFDSAGQVCEALEHYEGALVLSEETLDRRWQSHTLNSIGSIHYRRGEVLKARSLFERALLLIQAVGDRSGETLTLYNLARSELALNQLDKARERIEAAVNLVESLRGRVASTQLRSSYLASVYECFDVYIDVLMQLHRERPAEGFDRLALAASERAKARSLIDALAEASANIQEGTNPDVAAVAQRLREEINAKAEQHVRLLAANAGPKQTAAAAAELADLIGRLEDVESQIKLKSPNYADLALPTPLSPAQIQSELLDEDTVLLEYFLGETRSYVWAVTRDRIEGFQLPPRAEIDVAVRRFHRRITEPLRHSLGDYLQEAAYLGRVLIGPVQARLPGKRIVTVAHGVLQYLPFGALLDPQSGEPLVVAHEVVNVPSASVVAVQRQRIRVRAPAPQMIAIIGDPVYELDDPRLRGRSVRLEPLSADLKRSALEAGVTDRTLKFKRLPFAALETSAIVDLAPRGECRLLLGFDASRRAVLSGELSRYRIVHFATHGILNSLHPDLSGLVLSRVDRRGAARNGFLRLSDVYNLNLNADIVVLSACQTALGKEVKGEGLIGLARGFMYAGSPRVVATLWKADDRACAELMSRFYRGMVRCKLRPAAALQAAQVSMWKEERWRSPRYWAAFTLLGDWN